MLHALAIFVLLWFVWNIVSSFIHGLLSDDSTVGQDGREIRNRR